MDPRLRVGIVGTGAMGSRHARIAAQLTGCRISGIFDADSHRAAAVAQQYEVTAFDSLPALCKASDAVIVATPTNTHAEIAGQCLRAGLHVLVEKPIAASLEEGDELVTLSKQMDRTLMVGHVEQFNAAIITLRTLLDPEELFACELQRLSPVPGRDQSVDIILDLMIHDIEIALSLVGLPVVSLSALGHCIRGGQIDHASALLGFANGVTATLTASAVSPERARKARFYTREAQFVLDFAAKQLYIHRNGTASVARDGVPPCPVHCTEQALIADKDALTLEQEHFLDVISTGKSPLTDAKDGLEALRLAFAIQEKVNEQLAVSATA